MTVLPLRNALCGASILALVSSVGFAQTPTYEMTTDIPPEITTPDVVKTSIGTLNFFDGVPNKETIDTVYDYMDRARAVQAYVSTVPGVSQFAMRRGQRDIGATKVNQILIWDELADSKSLFLTGNSSTIYTWTYTDLANDGPTVIELPPGMLGAVDDMWFRYVTDLGTSGRIADCVSDRTLCATSTPAGPSVATPAAPPPFMVRLPAITSRAGGVSGAKAVSRTLPVLHRRRGVGLRQRIDLQVVADVLRRCFDPVGQIPAHEIPDAVGLGLDNEVALWHVAVKPRRENKEIAALAFVRAGRDVFSM